MYQDPYRDPEQGRLVDVAVEVRHQTADAILVFDGDHETWLPKDLAKLNDKGDTVTLPEWLATRESLI